MPWFWVFAYKGDFAETTWKSMLARGAVEALNRNRKGMK
jgi:hypothetical protein